jgi:hypothetical protein
MITGEISRLAVIDVDDLNLLPELEELLPEIKETTRVKTRRGYHYYFSLNGEYVKSTNNLFGRRLELKSNGNYKVQFPAAELRGDSLLFILFLIVYRNYNRNKVFY